MPCCQLKVGRGTARKSGSAPVSRILSRTAIYLELSLLCSLPAVPAGPASDCLCEIAPERVCHAAGLTDCAVGSYPAISPLPLRAVSFLLHFPSLPLDDNARALPGLLSCGVRTFLTPCMQGRAAVRCTPVVKKPPAPPRVKCLCCVLNGVRAWRRCVRAAVSGSAAVSRGRAKDPDSSPSISRWRGGGTGFEGSL